MQLWVVVIFYYHSSLPVASSCLSPLEFLSFIIK